MVVGEEIKRRMDSCFPLSRSIRLHGNWRASLLFFYLARETVPMEAFQNPPHGPDKKKEKKIMWWILRMGEETGTAGD